MSGPVLVRSTMRTWDCTLLHALGGVALIGAGLAAIFSLFILSAILVVLSVILATTGILIRRRRVRLRRWVQDQANGFRVIDWDGERTYADDRVLSMAFLLKQNYVNGLLKTVTRRFIVWMLTDAPKPERLEMTTTVKPEAADPLAGLVNRIGDLLYRRAKDEMAEGLPVLGEFWRLKRDELAVRRGDDERVCPVAELAAVEAVDSDICVWRTGQDAVFARVPKDSANAYLLWRLLAEQVAEKPAPSAPREESGLGRVIFERRAKKSTIVTVAIFGPAALALGGVLCAVGNAQAIFWGIACIAGGLACVPGLLHLRKAIFRSHQFGVHKAGLFRSCTLRYTEVAAISYSAIRQFHNGAYIGTAFNLAFDPVPERKRDRIHHSFQSKQVDEAFETLRDQVSRMIAGRMAGDLKKDGTVQWTKHLEFRKDGIMFQAFRFFRRREPVFIPYSDVHTYQIHQGTFFLWVRGRQKPLVREAMTRRNFFPGFYLLSSMLPLIVPGKPSQTGA